MICKSGGFRDANESIGSPADAATGRIDDRYPAGRRKLPQFRYRQALLIEGAIVQHQERIHAQFAQNSGMNRVGGRAAGVPALAADATSSGSR